MKSSFVVVLSLVLCAAAFCDYTDCNECNSANCKWCSDKCHTLLNPCKGTSCPAAPCSSHNASNYSPDDCLSIDGCSGVKYSDGVCTITDVTGVVRDIDQFCYCRPGYSSNYADKCMLSGKGPAFLGVYGKIFFTCW